MDWKTEMNNIYISGASGFLGKHLISQLLREDVVIYAGTTQFEKLNNYFDFPNIHILPAGDFTKVDWKNIDILVNCAYPRNEDGTCLANGLKYSYDLITCAVEHGLKALINISSQSVYSQRRSIPADENAEVCLESKYALGKYATELFVNSICGKSVLHTNIRLASLIGKGFDQRIVNRLINQLIKQNAIHIIGGNQIFGFLDVRDAASAIVAVTKSINNWNEIYNVGSVNSYTLIELADMILDVAREKYSKQVSMTIEQNDSFQNSSLNCNRFNKAFHWTQEYSMKRSIADIMEYNIEHEREIR